MLEVLKPSSPRLDEARFLGGHLIHNLNAALDSRTHCCQTAVCYSGDVAYTSKQMTGMHSLTK